MNRLAVCLGTLATACVACDSLPPGVYVEVEPATAHDAPTLPEGRSLPLIRPFDAEHEVDAEYENGLAELMPMAPVLGVPLVTAAYRAGYNTGLEEADTYQLFVDGEMRAVGCVEGFAAIHEYFSAEEAHVQEVCASQRRKTEPQGALFAEWRLKAARWAAAHLREERQIKSLMNIYVAGYNMGFLHEWEGVDQEAHVLKVVHDRCETVAAKIQPPLSQAQLTEASNRCVEGARAAKGKYGPELRCLPALREMTSEPGGQVSRAECWRRSL
jgi:hypothetical protein